MVRINDLRILSSGEVVSDGEKHVCAGEVERLHDVQQSARVRRTHQLHEHHDRVHAVHHHVENWVRSVVHYSIGRWNMKNGT